MFEHNREGELDLVRISGNIVASNAGALKAQLAALLQNGAVQLRLDLAGVKLIDSMGLAVLIAAHNSLRKTGKRLEVSNVCQDVRKLLAAMRLDHHFEIIG
ncbi:STAS domain-containing protein [Thiovibrio sp. JS02]